MFPLKFLKERLFFLMVQTLSGSDSPHFRGFTITLRRTTLGRTPLDEWSARRRDLYLTTHITHHTQSSLARAGFEPVIPEGERLQTHALDRAAFGIGRRVYMFWYFLYSTPVLCSNTFLVMDGFVFSFRFWIIDIVLTSTQFCPRWNSLGCRERKSSAL